MEFENERGAWLNITSVTRKPEFPGCTGAVLLGLD